MIRTFCLLATLVTFFASSNAQSTEVPLKINKGQVENIRVFSPPSAPYSARPLDNSPSNTL